MQWMKVVKVIASTKSGASTKIMRLFYIIIIKKAWQCNTGKEQLTPYQSEDPSPKIPTHRRKEEKEKIAGDKKAVSS